MKKTLTLSLIFAGLLVLLAPVTTQAQQVAALASRGNSRTLKTKRSVEQATKELSFSMRAWQKRKEVLRKYLATVNPSSTDYQVTQRSIAEIDVQVQDMARELVQMEFPSLPTSAPARNRAASATRASAPVTAAAREAEAPAVNAPHAARDDAAAPQEGELSASQVSVSSDGGFVIIKVDVSKFDGDNIRVESKDSTGKVIWTETFGVKNSDRRNGLDIEGVQLAASGDTTVVVTSVEDKKVTSTIVVPDPDTTRRTVSSAAKKKSGLVGLLLAGSVISQQAESISQADPFMGFVVGYDDTQTDGWRAHWRIQGIFQTQPKKEEAPVEGTGDGEPEPGTDEDAPADFRSFIASRKSFDVEMSAWVDRAIRKWIFFSGRRPSRCKDKDVRAVDPDCTGSREDPNVRVGFYGAVGGTAYVDKNELKGDESVKVEDTENDSDADGTNDQLELDTERAKIDNDIDHFYEFGLIGNFYKGMGTDNPKLFMQAKIGYGRYEALAGFNPGKDGFLNDSRNRFVGKLRVFPTFLDRNPEGIADASPMFGVEINAGRGPDQIKFFTGIATAIKLFK